MIFTAQFTSYKILLLVNRLAKEILVDSLVNVVQTSFMKILGLKSYFLEQTLLADKAFRETFLKADQIGRP